AAVHRPGLIPTMSIFSPEESAGRISSIAFGSSVANAARSSLVGLRPPSGEGRRLLALLSSLTSFTLPSYHESPACVPATGRITAVPLRRPMVGRRRRRCRLGDTRTSRAVAAVVAGAVGRRPRRWPGGAGKRRPTARAHTQRHGAALHHRSRTGPGSAHDQLQRPRRPARSWHLDAESTP